MMLFQLSALGDDEASDIPHFEEDDELGSVRDETLEEDAEDELMVEDRPSLGAPPLAPLEKPKKRRGGKSKRKKKLRKARPKKKARKSRPKRRRGGKKKKGKKRR